MGCKKLNNSSDRWSNKNYLIYILSWKQIKEHHTSQTETFQITELNPAQLSQKGETKIEHLQDIRYARPTMHIARKTILFFASSTRSRTVTCCCVLISHLKKHIHHKTCVIRSCPHHNNNKHQSIRQLKPNQTVNLIEFLWELSIPIHSKQSALFTNQQEHYTSSSWHH